jgi:hypothetical protein
MPPHSSRDSRRGPTDGRMMIRHALVVAALSAVTGGMLTGCFLDDDQEDCGGLGSSVAAAGCIDTSEPRCVGRQPSDGREIRVDSYDIRLPSGGRVHSTGADFRADPPVVRLAVTFPEGPDPELRDFSVRQTFDSAGQAYRVTHFCDNGVTWLVPS